MVEIEDVYDVSIRVWCGYLVFGLDYLVRSWNRFDKGHRNVGLRHFGLGNHGISHLDLDHLDLSRLGLIHLRKIKNNMFFADLDEVLEQHVMLLVPFNV